MSDRRYPVSGFMAGHAAADATTASRSSSTSLVRFGATPHPSPHAAPRSPDPVDAEAEELKELEFDLLTQTSQIVSQVREQLADVARREQSLQAQVASLENERRAFRIEKQQLEEQSSEIREQWQLRESELRAETDALKLLQGELAERDAEQQRSRAVLDAERSSYREELDQRLTQERLELQASLVAVESERAKLVEERQTWERQRLGMVMELDRQRHELAAALHFERQRLSEELTEAALSTQVREDREALLAERDRFQLTVDEWHRDKADAEADLHRRRDQLDAERLAVDQELAELRRQTWEEIDQQKAEHLQDLQKVKQEIAEAQQMSDVEIRKQQALLEGRLRFQQDHLDRSRREIEQAQDILRAEYQQSRQRLEYLVDLQRKQARQIERRRAIVEEYAESVRRQQESLAKLQQSLELAAENERQRLASERQTWELKIQTQAAENRRQTDLIALHAENLEARRERLDKLREDLEGRHGKLLETQMAVDEAWAQLQQVTGDENATARVEKSRETLSEYFRMLRDNLGGQQREFDEQRQLFEQQKADFRTEQQSFTDWIAQREQHLRRQEEQLQSQLTQLTEQETSWHRARDTWLTERLDAERIIRQLLTELSSSIESATGQRSIDLPEMPSLLGLSRFIENAA